MTTKKNGARERVDNGPARAIIETNPTRQVGSVYMEDRTTLDSDWESVLEYKAILTVTMCEEVERVATQRPKEELESGTYVPDLHVTTRGDSHLVEVKPMKELLIPKNLERYCEIASHYRRTGRQLYFLTEHQIELDPRWGNAFLCRRYVSGSATRTAEELTVAKLCSGPRTLSDLVSETNGRISLVDLYTLIAKKRVFFDWDKPLLPTSEISLLNAPFKGLTCEDIRGSGRFADLLAELALGRRPTDKRQMALARRWQPERSSGHTWGFVGGLPERFAVDRRRAGRGDASHHDSRASGETSERTDGSC